MDESSGFVRTQQFIDDLFRADRYVEALESIPKEWTSGMKSAVVYRVVMTLVEKFPATHRNGSVSTKAAAKALGLEEFYTQLNRPALERGSSVNIDDLLSAKISMTGSQVRRFRKVIQTDPELAQQVAKGDVPLNTAYVRVQHGRTTTVDRAFARRPKRSDRDAIERALRGAEVHVDVVTDRVDLVKGDVRATAWLARLRTLRTEVSRIIHTLERNQHSEYDNNGGSGQDRDGGVPEQAS